MAFTSATVGDLYDFVFDECTAEQVRDLLRSAQKDDESIRISADNKRDIIESNLRSAVSSGKIDVQRLYSLIRDSEENGAQHIFLYKSKNAAVTKRTADVNTVGNNLFGVSWQQNMGFPLFKKLPVEEEWSDLRATPDGGWIAKAYGQETIIEERGPEIFDRSENGIDYFTQNIKRRTVRTTSLARFNAKTGIFEIRLPLMSRQRLLDALFDRFVNMLKPAIDLEISFFPLDLGKARINLLRNYSPKNGVYRVKDARLRNSRRDTATFSSYDLEDENDLFADIRLKEAIDAILKGSPDCQHMAFWFLKTVSTDSLKDDYRVSMGSFAPNELTIGARSTPAAVDYILNRVREKVQ